MRSRGRQGLVLPAALALLWSSVALTQTPRALDVRGVVRSGTDGTPVEGAKVTLIRRVPAGQDISSESVLTDARGAFVLKAPAPGEYSISASVLPWAFGEYGRVPWSPEPQQWFTVSGPTSGIVVQLWEAPAVTGSVSDEHGEPLPRTFVQAMRVMTLGGRQVLHAVYGGNSGIDGRYSFRVISPGSYLIAARPWLSPADPVRRTAFYPGVEVPDAASIVSLAMGQVVPAIDFHLRREPGWVISGRVQLPRDVTGPSSLELFEASLESLPVNHAVARAPIEPLGRFAFPPVPRGSYEIRFVRYPALPADAARDGAVVFNESRRLPGRIAEVPAGPTWWMNEPVTVRDRDLTLQLRVAEGVRLSGRVVFEGAGPKPEPSSLPSHAIYLRSIDHRFFTGSPACAPREDGRFRTVQVPPGRYVIGMVDQYEGFQLTSVRLGGRETAGVAFDLTRDVDDVVMTFSPRPTTIAGQIAGGAGKTRSVVIWPVDESQWTGSGTGLGRMQRVLSSTGSYRALVFAGAYRVAALAGPTPADWESPVFLRSLVPFSQRVVLSAGQTVLLNLEPVPVRPHAAVGPGRVLAVVPAVPPLVERR